jgi:hypothetical protein
MHRGKWLKNKMKEMGYSYELVADITKQNRSTIFRMTQKEIVPFASMKVVADACGFDLRNDFPDTIELYEKKIPKDYRMLYLNTLEENKELREELAIYRTKSDALPGQ